MSVDPGGAAVVHVVAHGALRVAAAGEVVLVVGRHECVVDAALTEPAKLMAGSGAVARRSDPSVAAGYTFSGAVTLAFRFSAGQLDGGVVLSRVARLVDIAV